MTIQITSVVPRDMMTEEEVTRAFDLVRRLEQLREMRGEKYGRLTIAGLAQGAYTPSITMAQTDFEATIAFLTERFTSELAMLGVKPKETPQ